MTSARCSWTENALASWTGAAASSAFGFRGVTVPATLDVLVEAMGRVNFGVEVHDRKGLLAPVTLRPLNGEAAELTGWQVFLLPLDETMRGGLRFGRPKLE